MLAKVAFILAQNALLQLPDLGVILLLAKPVAPGDILAFYDPEEHLLKASEIPLKTTDTTFSTPLNLKAGWYLRRGIEDCRMVEIPPEALAAKKEESHPDVERLSLFDEEGEKE